MSAIEKLTAWISSIIAASCPTILTFKVGYITDLASGQADYDALLLLPPKYTKNPRATGKDYDIHYFLIRQDRGANGADQMTSDERLAAWGALEILNDVFLTALMADPSNFQVVDSMTVDPNSGGGDQLLPDAVLWIEVTFKLRVNDC